MVWVENSQNRRCMCFFMLRGHIIDIKQGPDAVHIQQVGLKELKRVPALVQREKEMKKKQAILMEKAGIKAHL